MLLSTYRVYNQAHTQKILVSKQHFLCLLLFLFVGIKPRTVRHESASRPQDPRLNEDGWAFNPTGINKGQNFGDSVPLRIGLSHIICIYHVTTMFTEWLAIWVVTSSML